MPFCSTTAEGSDAKVMVDKRQRPLGLAFFDVMSFPVLEIHGLGWFDDF